MDLSNTSYLISAFIIGISGSFHCLGMCGGLVLAISKTFHQMIIYQIGRLLGYLLLAVIFMSLGSSLSFMSPWISLLGGVFIAIFFITMGIHSWPKKHNKKRGRLSLISKISSRVTNHRLWKKILYFPYQFQKIPWLQSFLVGFLSLFLPCGFLYAAILGIVMIGPQYSSVEKLAGVSVFWLGTVPSLVFAPYLIKNFLNPIRGQAPKILALFFLTLGIFTLATRLSPMLKYFSSPSDFSWPARENCCEK